MFSIIKSPSYNNFFNLVKESKENIYLCAPFIKKMLLIKYWKIKKKALKW